MVNFTPVDYGLWCYDAPFHKSSSSSQCGRFSLILWRGPSFVFSWSDCHLTNIILIYWIKIDHLLLWIIMIDSCGFVHCQVTVWPSKYKRLHTSCLWKKKSTEREEIEVLRNCVWCISNHCLFQSYLRKKR